MKCKLTEKQLSQLMPTKMILIDRLAETRMDIISYMESHGMASSPLVRIYQGNKMVDEWNDFQVSKIKQWKGRVG
jgi:hypothetical protein